jgi:hypothetical protein
MYNIIMEKFKPTNEANGFLKMFKISTLALLLGTAGNSFSQEKTSSIEQMIKDAKKYEVSLSEKAKSGGVLGNINNNPSSTISNDSRISKVIYTDNKMTEISGIVVGKGNAYFFDNNGDGELDLLYIDKNEIPFKLEEGAIKTLIASAGISQVELDLSNNDMLDQFVCFNLNKNEVYETKEQSISSISEENQAHVKETLQQKFNDVLKSNLESIK